MDYELVIVGAGPAGLSAALNAAYRKLKTVVLDSSSAGGALTNKYPWKKVDEVLGYPDLVGYQVAKNMTDHVRGEGAEIRENESVENITREGGKITVETIKARYSCKAAILAIGLGIPKKLGVPGETMDGVVYSLLHPTQYEGKKVLVVGGGDSALESAEVLSRNKAEVTLIHRGDSCRASEKNCRKLAESSVKALMNTELKEVRGSGKAEKALIFSNKTKEEAEVNVDAVLLSLGTTSNKEFLGRVGVKVDEKGNVVVDNTMRTSMEGVFAAGDVTGRWLRIPNAMGEGGFAALNAYKYIKNPYWA